MKQKADQFHSSFRIMSSPILKVLNAVSPFFLSMLFVATIGLFAATLTAFGGSETLQITAVVEEQPQQASGNVLPQVDRSTVSLSGYTAPSAKITLLIDGAVSTTLIANSDGSFQITLNNVVFGYYQYSIIIEDSTGVSSSATIINANVYSSEPLVYSNLILTPTINSSSISVETNQYFVVQGYAAPGATIYIGLPDQAPLATAVADGNGYYQVQIQASFGTGIYSLKAFALLNGMTSDLSKPLQLLFYDPYNIEQSVIPPEQLQSCVNINKDNKIDLVDFSILLYWYGVTNPAEDIDCNKDRTIDITDFSILMYFWTG